MKKAIIIILFLSFNLFPSLYNNNFANNDIPTEIISEIEKISNEIINEKIFNHKYFHENMKKNPIHEDFAKYIVHTLKIDTQESLTDLLFNLYKIDQISNEKSFNNIIKILSDIDNLKIEDLKYLKNSIDIFIKIIEIPKTKSFLKIKDYWDLASNKISSFKIKDYWDLASNKISSFKINNFILPAPFNATSKQIESANNEEPISNNQSNNINNVIPDINNNIEITNNEKTIPEDQSNNIKNETANNNNNNNNNDLNTNNSLSKIHSLKNLYNSISNKISSFFYNIFNTKIFNKENVDNSFKMPSGIENEINSISKEIIEKSKDIKSLRLSKNKFYQEFFHYLKYELEIHIEDDLNYLLSNIFNKDKSKYKAIFFKVETILKDLDKIDEKNLIFLQYHIEEATMPIDRSYLFNEYNCYKSFKNNKYQEKYNYFWGNDKQFDDNVLEDQPNNNLEDNSQQQSKENILLKQIQEEAQQEKQEGENEKNKIRETSKENKINLILNIIIFNKDIYKIFFEEYIFSEDVKKLKKFIEFLYDKYYLITESTLDINNSSDENRFDLIYSYFLSIYKNKIDKFSGDYFSKLIITSTIDKEKLYIEFDDYYEKNKEDGFFSANIKKILPNEEFEKIMDSQKKYKEYLKIIEENIILIQNHLIHNSDNDIEIYFKNINNNKTNLKNIPNFIKYNRNNYLNNLNNEMKELEKLSSSKKNIISTEKNINRIFNNNSNDIDGKDIEILLKRLKQNIDEYEKYCSILKNNNSNKYISNLRKKITDYKKRFDDIIAKKNIDARNYNKKKNIILSALTFIGLGSLYNFENNFEIYKKENPNKGRFSYLKDILFNRNKKFNILKKNNQILNEEKLIDDNNNDQKENHNKEDQDQNNIKEIIETE